MRLSQDGEPCPARAASVMQGCEGYTKTPQMEKEEKTGDKVTGVLAKGLILMVGVGVGYYLMFGRK